MKVLLLTPPLLQPNAPYAAMPAIAGFLRSRGVEVEQRDLSLALVLKLFSHHGMELLAQAAHRKKSIPAAQWFLENEDSYREWIAPILSFLQGKDPELAWSIVHGSLPEGIHFRELYSGAEDEEGTDLETEFFGLHGIADRAKMRASLFLDDVADLFRELVDSEFGFSRYAEHLAAAAPSFDPLWKRLTSRKMSALDQMIEALALEAIAETKPTHVGVTVPFPGTVVGAFRVAQAIRRAAPNVHLVLGGGYVNSELREVEDARVFDFFDDICFDEGFAPWLGILGLGPRVRTLNRDSLGQPPSTPTEVASPSYEVFSPDYTGLDLSAYFSLMETSNPMQRLWSDGRWQKMQLANGCYWHRCAFCDVALDYIGCYRAPDPAQAVDAIVACKQKTGLSGFHFTDEALAPSLVRGLCEELLRRHVRISWWGNVRLEKTFDDELVDLMARAGCIAITAGLECANDRLLKLMNKGITIASARKVCRAFSQAGILVHLYLMYGFPTESYAETLGALEIVRDFFAEGFVQSAFWHRFALTVHSPIAKHPSDFGIELQKEPPSSTPRFARNEIPYREPRAPNLEALGKGLALATYNFMRGQGLDWPVEEWFQDEENR